MLCQGSCVNKSSACSAASQGASSVRNRERVWGKLGPGLASPAAEEIEPGIPSNTIGVCTSVTPKPQPALVVWMPRREQACGGPSHSGRLLKGHTRLPGREGPVGSPRPSVQAELRPSPAGGSTARISGSPA